MKSFITPMLEEMETLGYSPRTRELYAMCLTVLCRHAHKKPTELKASDIDAYLLHLRRLGRGDSTIRVYYESIKHYFAHAGRLHEFPLKRFRGNKRRLPIILSPQEISRIMGACDSIMIQSIIALAYSAGLRISEIINLNICDIDYSRGTVFVRRGKNGKSRYSILSTKTAEIINYYTSRHPLNRILFPSPLDENHPVSTDWVHRNFKKAATLAGVSKRVTLHSLRHAFATHLLENGTNIFQVKELLGHESLSTTLMYLHVRPFDPSKVVSPLDLISETKALGPWPLPGQDPSLFS